MSKIAEIHQQFNSLLSLQPLVTVLRKMIADDKPGARRLYEGLLREINAVPSLLEPIDDLTPLIKHAELVETLLSTIFPPATAANEGLFAIAIPFRHETIYASPAFKELFLTEGNNTITLPDKKTIVNINKAMVRLAYNVILKKFYALNVPAVASSVHPFTDAESGLTKYLELKLNAQFTEVKLINKDFAMPTNFSPQHTLDMDDLQQTFPLDNFQFEGLVVINVDDVTGEQVIAEIKNTLLTLDSTSDVAVYQKLQRHIQTLVSQTDITVGITPFFKMNDYYLFADAYYQNSLLYKHPNAAKNSNHIIQLCQKTFSRNDNPLLYQTLSDRASSQNELLNYYYEVGTRSLIICPLKCDDNQLIGLLEIASEQPGTLRYGHLSKLQPAMSLFSLALEKNIESLEMQINKTVKEHFTAIQSAVEWKFTEAAFNYIKARQVSDSVKIPPITFEDVYPLYGAIDIRNSSVERTHAIQLDILEQLHMARQVLEAAALGVQFPLLKEIQFKIDQYITATSDALLSEEEMLIYEFLQQDLDGLFRHLQSTRPELQKSINDYFAALDPQRNIIYHHRKDYEDSITKINDVLDRFMDSEQQAAQKVFPHYFERYITDGIEFNIYVGQSLAPSYSFNEIYVKNLKLWQLTVLTRAARLANTLEKRLPLPLQTTQLILAHSIPLTISFRRKERKFDVDGAYNIRYEIIKKRIDKVHIKDTEERLTQPGKVAIVYSQQKELNEYMEYIQFLQAEGLLTDSIEHLELEDTQGINGLKAIRVDVNLEPGDVSGSSKVELSSVTAKELVRNKP